MAKRNGTRRPNNKGSISRRPNGMWRAQVSIDHHRSSTSAKTQREAQAWIDEMLGQIEVGMTFLSMSMTVEELIADWLVSSKRSIRSSTWEHYSQLCRDYVNPMIGKQKFKDLRQRAVQHLCDDLLNDGVGYHTVVKAHAALQRALSYAVRQGLISKNPAASVKFGDPPAARMQILDMDQVHQMLLTAKGTKLEALLQLAVATGMRQMELLGLKWADINWLNGTVTVDRQLRRPKNGVYDFGFPKTKAGHRTIRLGSETLQVLRSHLDRQQAERRDLGETWQDWGLIFPNRNGGPKHPRNCLREFKRLLEKAGLPDIRFHDLRHTCASICLSHNMPLILVSAMFGHASHAITSNVYGHLVPSMQPGMAATIDSLITPVQMAAGVEAAMAASIDTLIAPTQLHQTAPALRLNTVEQEFDYQI